MKKRTKWVVILIAACCIGFLFIAGIEYNSVNLALITDSSSYGQTISESSGYGTLSETHKKTKADKVVDDEENIEVSTNDKKKNSDSQAEDIKISGNNKKETETQTSSSTNKPTVTSTSTPDYAKCGAVGHTADGTCPICGKVKISNCNHNRVTNNICRLCGDSVCMEQGHEEVGICPVCGSVKHSSRGHTEKGVCDACGSTITFVEGATEHYHGNGSDNGICPVCGLSYSPSLDISGPSTDNDGSCVFEYHFNSAYTSCPTCGFTWCPTCGSGDHTVHPAATPTPQQCSKTGPGHTENGECSICNATRYIHDSAGHNVTGTCSLCGSTKTEEDFYYLTHGRNGHTMPGVCAVCGAYICTSAGHSEPGVCSGCGLTKCGTTGHSTVGTCPYCGSIYTATTTEHYHGNGSDNGVCPVCGLSYSPTIDISGPSGADDLTDIFS